MKRRPSVRLAKMPVREVTVFKDGHALMLHRGKMPVDPSGDVLMDYLPAPVLGTFWPYSADKNVKLTAVVAGKRKVLVERTSLTLRELLEGNVGAEVDVNETPVSGAATAVQGLTYTAMIVGLPERSSKELESDCAARRRREAAGKEQSHPDEERQKASGPSTSTASSRSLSAARTRRRPPARSFAICCG